MSSTSRDLSKFKIVKVRSISIYNKDIEEPIATWELDENEKLKLKNPEERKN